MKHHHTSTSWLCWTVSIVSILGSSWTVGCGSHPVEPVKIERAPSDAGVDTAAPDELSVKDWMSYCREALNRAAKQAHPISKPPTAISPVGYVHVNHSENRFGAGINGDRYRVRVWIKPPEDLVPATDWQWTPLWYSADDADLNGRPFGTHEKHNGALGAELQILEKIKEDKGPQSPSSDPSAVETLFRAAVDACLDAGSHLIPIAPFSINGYGPTEMERFFNRLDGSVIPKREYTQPICQTGQFSKVKPIDHDNSQLPPLVIGGLDLYHNLSTPEARTKYRRQIRKYSRMMGRPTIEVIRAENGEVVASFIVPKIPINKPNTHLNNLGQLVLENAFPSAGLYSVELIWHANRDARYTAHVAVDKGDIEVLLELWFLDRSERRRFDERPPLPKHQNPWMLARYSLIRVSPAEPEVALYRAWSPQPDGMPDYVIANQLRRPIHGVEWMANFFGRVDRFENGQWTSYDRGGKCGTVTGGTEIPFGQVVSSIEGYYIGPVTPFTPGRYRYVVRYGHRGRNEGVPTERIDAGETTYSVEHHFELVDRFNIEATPDATESLKERKPRGDQTGSGKNKTQEHL